MTTPRRTRLVRAADLAGLRTALVAVARDLDLATAADTFVVVPTRAAGEQLRRTLEDRLLDATRPACLLPAIGTRADLYDAFADRLPDPPRLASAVEREVLLLTAAREAEVAGVRPPFHLRPSLVAEMLSLYDYVRRQHRTCDDFERLLASELEPAAESDRGARQLLDQTRFLAAAYRGYERRLAETGGVDEHGLLRALLEVASPRPLARVVVTVGDRLSEPEGLWPADVRLLTAIAGLASIDIVSTAAVLDAGLIDRLRMAFVGIDEASADPCAQPDRPARPVLVVPAPATPGGERPRVFTYRDREDELEGVARRVKAARRAGGASPIHREAVVVARPLPYLYLARDVFGGAGLPFETLDTLPLAAEPYAAAVDLVLAAVAEHFSRTALVALLGSPHFRFAPGGVELQGSSVEAADRALADRGYLGGLDRLRALAAECGVAALDAAVEAAERLAPLAEARPLADQLDLLAAFLLRHDRPPDATIAEHDRRARVHAAILEIVTGLGAAYRAHAPAAAGTVHEVAPAIRRWLGVATVALRTGAPGLQILDVHAARFADVDEAHLVGLVDGEWPERARRNPFYPPALLLPLEPARPERVEIAPERDRLRAGRAMFLDLLRLARRRTCVSTFSLEFDAVTEPSILLDDLDAAGLDVETPAPDVDARVFAYEALALDPPAAERVGPPAALWARVRMDTAARPPSRSRGEAGGWLMPRVSVSRLEQYAKCPFQFYAANVLGLQEEPEDEVSRSPLERGRFLHALFEAFFQQWQQRGRGRITVDSLDEARALLAETAAPALAALPLAEAGLERARLFGSAAGAGIAERVFAVEAERPVNVDRRLMEYALDDVFTFAARDGAARDVRLRAKVDRVDLLADGTFRLIDYKTRSVLHRRVALQVPIYTAAVRQRLAREQGRDVPPGEALYLCFEGPKPFVRIEERGGTIESAIEEASHRLVDALDGIAAGRFPSRPYQRSLCGTCGYATVCRERGSGSSGIEGWGEPAIAAAPGD